MLKLLGPGFITGASDDDPSSVGTATLAGASFGFHLLWAVVASFPMMVIAQLVAARVALVSGHGAARLLKNCFSPKVVVPLIVALVAANTVTIGADLAAVAAAVHLLAPVPDGLLMVLLAGVIIALMLSASYRTVSNIFKWLALTLVAYVAAAVLAKPDAVAMLHGTFRPHFQSGRNFLWALVAIFGTSVQPYMFFWQSSGEVEEQRRAGYRSNAATGQSGGREIKYAAWDVVIGMFFSQLVMYFMVVAAAATLFRSGHTHLESAQQAAAALAPLAGKASSLLFTAGLVGSGFLAIPVMAASSAYALGDLGNWRSSLDRKPIRAKKFYLAISGSVAVALAVNFIGWNPIEALVWASVINAAVAPPLLALLLLIANNREVMGDKVNGWGANILGWGTVAAMGTSLAALLASLG